VSWCCRWLLSALLLLLPISAHAAVVPFSGTLSVAIASFPPVTVTASGSLQASGVPGSPTALTLPADAFLGSASLPVTDPGAFPVGGVRASLRSGAGRFTGTGGALAGTLPLPGTANVCLFASCAGGPPANVAIPFTRGGTDGVGLGGAAITVDELVSVTLTGAAWTTGVASVPTPAGTVFRTGAIVRGADGTRIRLVTPVAVQTNIGASPSLPAFAVLELDVRLVPEAGTLALLAGGLVGLGLARRAGRRA